MIGGHVNQTITFYEAVPGELRIKFDDGAEYGRMIHDRLATDEDIKAQAPAYAVFLRAMGRDALAKETADQEKERLRARLAELDKTAL